MPVQLGMTLNEVMHVNSISPSATRQEAGWQTRPDGPVVGSKSQIHEYLFWVGFAFF